MKRAFFLNSFPATLGAASALLATQSRGVDRSARAQGAAPAAEPTAATFAAQIAQLEHFAGGRLGVCAFVAGSDGFMGYREHERFPMCSTFKALLAATVLANADAGREHLARVVRYGRSDLLEYAPITTAHVATGMSVGDLCAAAIEHSDNTAANLLLASLGGPHVVTHFARSLGDATTRLDRNEPSLNSALPNDPRDTTSPLAMARTLERVMLGAALRPPSKHLLQTWMFATATGANRLRAGVPRTWRVGDKTGTGDHGATNDVAVLWPPEQRPIVVTAFFVDSIAPIDAREATLRDVARVVAKTFGAVG